MNGHLEIDSTELREAIGWFIVESGVSRRIKKGEPAGSAALSFRAPYLAISNADYGHRYEASATGDWPKEAVIDAGYLVKLKVSIVNGARTSFRVEDGRLYFGDWVGIPCWWRTTRAYPEPLQADSELLHRLLLRLNHSDVELHAKGLLSGVRDAEEEQARKISEAIEVLAPLGIGIWDLYRASESAARWHGMASTKNAGDGRHDREPTNRE